MHWVGDATESHLAAARKSFRGIDVCDHWWELTFSGDDGARHTKLPWTAAMDAPRSLGIPSAIAQTVAVE